MKRLLTFLTLALLLVSNVLTINAAVKTINKRLYVDEVYTSYDITGDNKKDRIEFKYSAPVYDDEDLEEDEEPRFDGYKQLNIYINNKSVYEIYDDTLALDFSDRNDSIIRYIRLTNNKKYLLVCPNEYDSFLLGYKSGKLKKVKDHLWTLPGLTLKQSENKIYEPTGFQSVKVKKNSIVVRSSALFYNTEFGFSYDVTYTYKKGKFVKANTGTIVGYPRTKGLTTKSKIQVYKDKKLKKKSFKIKKNKKIKLLTFGGNSKKYWIKVKSGKKTGYIKFYFDYKLFNFMDFDGEF